MTITDPQALEIAGDTDSIKPISTGRRMPGRRQTFVQLREIVPLAMITAAFLVYALPPYLSLDPATSRVPAMTAAIGIATWMSWVVNLLIAEGWLHRRRRPVRHAR